MFGLFGYRKVPNVKNKKLISYKYSSGGGMNGGGESTQISIVDGEVILTYSYRLWSNDDETVTEYKLDNEVLTDIERLFRKYNMSKWHRKKFSNIFILDAPSCCFSFKFDDNTRISFSSQVYPMFYRRKLLEIDKVIEQYKNRGTLEPKLVIKEKTAEELEHKYNHDNGLVQLEVFEYSTDKIFFRILNGTNEEVLVDNWVKLVRNRDGEILYNKRKEYLIEVSGKFEYAEDILTGRLEEGIYTIYVGEYFTEFEIRKENPNS